VARSVNDDAAKLASFPIEDVNLVACFQPQHVAQVTRFVRSKSYGLILEIESARQGMESSTSHLKPQRAQKVKPQRAQKAAENFVLFYGLK
jgi:hypothetical protein